MKTFLTCAVLLSFLAAVPLLAGDNETVFIQKCGSCHQKGGKADPVNPADKAGLVWKKYFKRNRHPVDLSGTISEEEMSAILSYLQNHAADSDHPVAAAIPK